MTKSRFINPKFLIQFLVGTVFMSEGLQKFLFPTELGVGRFEHIGFPIPNVLAPFVGGVEILFGTLVLCGIALQKTVIPLLIVISTAIITTKLPMLSSKGVWATLHESRADYSMLLCLVFLLIAKKDNV